MNLTKGSRLGRYELILRIGRGGMASVWLAKEHTGSLETDRLVALKVMLPGLAGEPEFISMFLDEVHLVRAIHHPNVVDVYEVGEQHGTMWMAMEWVEGESLQGLFNEACTRQAIPIEIAVCIVAEAAAGLHAAHELKDAAGVPQNLVHRDVSPHNILIGTAGQVKLVDFGIAKAIDRIGEKTKTGHLKGKFGYMSPEQVKGRRLDRRSDLFSLGIVLYELTTGRRLFRGKHEMHTLELVAKGPIERPSSFLREYPPELEQILMCALSRAPDQRYATAAAFELELRGFLKEQRVLVPSSGVASLLKRVVGGRIEERRKAARRALAGKDRAEALAVPELISADPAFTPTGSERVQESAPPSHPSATTSLSRVGTLTRGAPSRPPARAGSAGLLVALLMLAGGTVYYASVASLSTPHTTAVQSSVTAREALPRPAPAEPQAAAPASVGPLEPPRHIPLVKVDELALEQLPEPFPAISPPPPVVALPAPAAVSLPPPEASLLSPAVSPLSASSGPTPRTSEATPASNPSTPAGESTPPLSEPTRATGEQNAGTTLTTSPRSSEPPPAAPQRRPLPDKLGK